MVKKKLLNFVLFIVGIISLFGCETENKKLNEHKVKFLDTNGNVLEEHIIPNGKNAYYYGDTPIKDEEENCSYRFLHWNKNLNDISEDMTIEPVFSKIEKKTNFSEEIIINSSEAILKEEKVAIENKEYIVPSYYDNCYIEKFTIYINHYVSEDCNFTVRIPNSIKSLNFEHSHLPNFDRKYYIDIYYEGTITEWVYLTKNLSGFIYYGGRIFIQGKELTELIIPEGVDKIPIGTLSNSNLEKVEIPDSIRSIEFDKNIDKNKIFLNENGNLYLGNSQNQYLYLYQSEEIYNTKYEVKKETKIVGLLDVNTTAEGIHLHGDLREISCLESDCENTPIYFNGDFYDYFSLQLPKIKTFYIEGDFYIDSVNIKKVTSFDLPKNIKILTPYKMRFFDSLEKLILPDTVEIIQGNAFSNTPIKYLIINDNLKLIESYAFTGSKINVYLPDSIEYVEENAFYGHCRGVFLDSESVPSHWNQLFLGYGEIGIDRDLKMANVCFKGQWAFDENGIPYSTKFIKD